jgi:uncharacterized membrane protein
MSFPFAIFALLLIPRPPPLERRSTLNHTHPKWVLIDIPGCLLILVSLLLLNTSLTLGAASDGWTKPKFIVPLILSLVIGAIFLIYEYKLEDHKAALPRSMWRVKNLGLMCFLAMNVASSITAVQLVMVERYEAVFGNSDIMAAVRFLPQGIAMTILCIILP